MVDLEEIRNRVIAQEGMPAFYGYVVKVADEESYNIGRICHDMEVLLAALDAKTAEVEKQTAHIASQNVQLFALETEITDLKRQLAEARERQPIATAPKDGTFIIAYCPEDQSRWWCSWQSDRWYGVDEMGLTREGHSQGDDAVTGWFVTEWSPAPTFNTQENKDA